MLLSTGAELDCPPRFGTPRNYDRPTYGAEVGEIAARLGQPLMPWQQWVADVSLEYDPSTSGLFYTENDLSVMRRMGKTSLLRPLLVWRSRRMASILGAAQHCAYTAQTGKDARRKWEEDQVGPIDRSAYGPLGRARIPGRYGKVKFDNNDPGIFWANGSSIRPVAPTETAGHGTDADLACIDEAFAHADDRVEQAFGPAMLTRRSPQLWVTSAAGTEKSVYWWRKVQAGRAMCESGNYSPTVAYFEWSIGDDEDYTDPEVWWRRLPALGHTVTEQAIAAELDKVLRNENVDADDEGADDRGLERFLRPYMGRWCRFPTDDRRPSAIPAREWHAARHLDSKPVDPVAFGVEVAQDRSLAYLSVSAPSTLGGSHVEIIDTRPGVDWVPARLAELAAKWNSRDVALEASGPTGALVPALRAAGLNVHEVKGRDYQRACADLFDAVMSGRLHHLGQDALDAAVVAAARKVSGEGWSWDRRGGTNQVTPLVAVTVARWVALTSEPPAAPASSGFVFVGDDW